ncbi:relaxase/mobilization nuclease domain-containing protein [Microcoleus sp. FACHB-1515]|uniref:relaxase/mobilization nuclease domain-containing protein n=1 Tax=Cyanophyceae TaxID=3028117 RepID=UPI001682E524|nr:relaxase/mobilization nuclease domain-containing protein [Microcoleus sp. FACHB-1515]MBD2092578.1 relaxase/mobilization nuclease domain-containing protein [Microcoleus sp. FACHB-1515]
MVVAKLHQNNSAKRSFQYVASKSGARIIGGNVAPWVSRDDLSINELKQIINQATSRYLMACDLKPIKRPIYHASLSIRPGENLNDNQFCEMAELFLSALILTSEQPDLLQKLDDREFREAIEKFRQEELPKYQYTIVRHLDEDHPHIHLVWAKTNLETEKAHSTSFDRYRAQLILRFCEREYGLAVQPNSWEVTRKAESTRQVRKEATTGIPSKHKQLQEMLDRAAAKSRSVCEFIENAQAEGVEVRVQFTRTGKSKGISYGLEGDGIAGSTLGTRYSFSNADPGLVKNLGLDYDPERDNAQIQALCQRKPLSHDQRQQNALRDDITASLGRSAAAISELDFCAPTPAGAVDATGESGSSVSSNSGATAERSRNDRPAVAARDAGVAAVDGAVSDGNGDQSTDRQLERAYFPSVESVGRSPQSGRSANGAAGDVDRGVGNGLDEINRQLCEFERVHAVEIERIHQRIQEFDSSLKQRRAEQRLRAQAQAALAEAIAPAAERVFEFYAAQNEDSPESELLKAKSAYLVEIDEIPYVVSRDNVTKAYAVQREDNQDLTVDDVQAWQAAHKLLDQQQQELDAASRAALPLDSVPTRAVFTTLEQARNLTQQDWIQLTPGEQINLVEMARSHQRTEPWVTVQTEQWVGQAKQVQRQLKEFRDQYALEKKNLQVLEARGQRSLLNPFGTSGDQLREARSQLDETKALWQQAKRDWDGIEGRQKQRQQQESVVQKWAGRLETQGMKRITELMRQPELQTQYEAIERTVGQLREWRKLAGRLGYSADDREAIGQLVQTYLQGGTLPEGALQLMRKDLQQIQQSDLGLAR